MIDFFDFCSEMLCVANRQGFFIRLNPAWTRTLGWSLEELTRRPYLELVHPDDVEATEREAALLQGKNHETVYFLNRYRCKDGTFKWLEWQAKRKPGTDQILATAREVTDRKKSEQQFKAIFDQAPMGIALLNSRTGAFLQLNPKYASIVGRSQEELLQLDFQTITHPEDLQEDLDNMALLLEGKIRRFRMEKRYLLPDGSIVWVDLTVVPLCEEGESPESHIDIVEDISETKRAEELLQTREAQLRGLLDNSSNVIYLKDPQGRYMLVNLRHQQLFHLTEEEIYGKTDLDLFPPETAKLFRSSDAQVWQAQRPLTFEEDAPHDDGLHTYRSVKFPVKDKQGHMVALGGISTDITDLTKAYQDLKEKERLLRGLIEVQEKEQQFICYEFHDGLIQYVVGAKMTLEGYQQQAGNGSPIIDGAIKNLQKGIEDGRRVIRGIRPTVLDDMGVEAAIEDLIDQVSSSDVAIQLRSDSPIGRFPKRLEATVYRVVQEALNNARKHSGCKIVTVTIRQHPGSFEATIQDDGCGFDVNSVDQTGFGLLGMNERVRLMGGDFHIQSQQGKGATISIRMPIENGDQSEEA